jgi:hypothetical protein
MALKSRLSCLSSSAGSLPEIIQKWVGRASACGKLYIQGVGAGPNPGLPREGEAKREMSEDAQPLAGSTVPKKAWEQAADGREEGHA